MEMERKKYSIMIPVFSLFLSIGMILDTFFQVYCSLTIESGVAMKVGGKKAKGRNMNIAIETGKNSQKKEVSNISDSDYIYMTEEVVIPAIQ